jgi:peptidoglycan/xylan/chitin deacetylase (PgdA/CDA1 family)
MIQNNKMISLMIIASIFIIFSIDNAYAEETQTIEIEIKYTDGDRAEYEGTKILAYQDFNKIPILEKELIGNPDSILVEKYHKYKIEVYVNGIFADVGYIQVDDSPVKMDINIPMSGGIQFEIFYKNGVIPIKGATLILKSPDNSELGRVLTNDQGQTGRYWIQSTILAEDHYVAEVYLGNELLKIVSTIKIQPGIAVDEKIITNIPEIVEELITINLYDDSNIIKSTDGDYSISLQNLQDDNSVKSKINVRGDVNFSSLKSGTYLVKITSSDENENKSWPEKIIQIIGEQNKFNIFKYSENELNERYPFETCNCVSFRLDDIQDYWLADTQVQLVELFEEKKVPLSLAVIGGIIGEDDKITSMLKRNIENDNVEIVSHSWNNDVLTSVDNETQEKYIVDTNKRIFEVYGVTPTSFVPPENLYNDKSVEILKNNGFTHLSSHIEEIDITRNENDSFYRTPAITETAKLVNNDTEWKINDKNEIKEKVIQSIKNNGYAIVMMHPQEFALNDQGNYDIPNQKTLLELSLLLDEIKELDVRLVKIGEVKPYDPTTNVVSKEKIESVEVETVEEEIIEEESVSCNCVAFRFDNVQDYWLNDVQIEIMQTFIENKIPLTIGIIADVFGYDQKIVDFIKTDTQSQENYLKIATKGVGLVPYTEYSQIEQNNNLKESIDILESIFNEKPRVLIPPQNKFNSDTLSILEENQITHISTSLFAGDSPPFELLGENIYRFPQTSSTGKYSTVTNLFEGNPHQQTFNESISSIENFGFAVIGIQVQEFSIIEDATYVNSVNTKQINELKKLIKSFNEKGIKIVPIIEINSNISKIIPPWVKNSAEWWAEGVINDDTFVQGIEFLVQENIIKVTNTSQSNTEDQSVPVWIKNNAEWWAEGVINDDTFVQGIEFLVQENIIKVTKD